MIRPGRCLGVFFQLLASSWLASGCVRLNEPGSFICNSDADCDSGEKCSQRDCVAKDSCAYDGDCGPREHCRGYRCVAVECEASTAALECGGYACLAGACAVGCNDNFDCASGFHCDARECVPGVPRANGISCTKGPECKSGKCCAEPSGSVCADECSPAPEGGCTASHDSASGFCCATSGGKNACSAAPCAPLPCRRPRGRAAARPRCAARAQRCRCRRRCRVGD